MPEELAPRLPVGTETGIKDIYGHALKVGDSIVEVSSFVDFDHKLNVTPRYNPETRKPVYLEVIDFVYGKCIFIDLKASKGVRGYANMLIGEEVMYHEHK